jgi:hypothetical protein
MAENAREGAREAMAHEKLVEPWNGGLRIGCRAHFEAAEYYDRLHLAIVTPKVVP